MRFSNLRTVCFASFAGDSGLTKDKELQGKRKFGTDSYVGTYEADYDSFSGEEVLFGGTALERDTGNEIEISCDTNITDGTLKLILKTGSDDPQILFDTLQSYSETIELPSAKKTQHPASRYRPS